MPGFLGFFSISAGLLLCLFFWQEPNLAVFFGGISLTIIQFLLLKARLGEFSATMIPVFLINGVMLGGVALWPFVEQEAATGFALTASQSGLANSGLIALLFTSAFTVGAMIPGQRQVLDGLTDIGFGSKIPTGAMISGVLFFLLLEVLGRGETILRGTYLETSGPPWVVIGSAVWFPVAILSASILLWRPGAGRFFGLLFLIVLAAIAFGRATRWLAVIPLFMLLAFILSGKALRPRHLMFAATSSVLLLPIPLVLRGNPEGVGILTLFEEVVDSPQRFFSLDSVFSGIGNVLFGAPLAAYVAELDIPRSAFWTSVSPLFSRFTEWSTLYPTLMVNRVTPFNGLGELAAQGSFFLFSIGVLAGLAFSSFEALSTRLDGLWAQIGLLSVAGVSVLYSFQILQYQLRASSRLIWYLLLAIALLFLFRKIGEELSRGRLPVTDRLVLSRP